MTTMKRILMLPVLACAIALLSAAPAMAQMKPGAMPTDKLSSLMAHVLFKTVCVDNYNDSVAVRGWAGHYMRKMEDSPQHDEELSEVWVQGASVGGFVLRLTEKPWSCMVSAENAQPEEVHRQINKLANEYDASGEYQTALMESLHQESGTRYSLLRLGRPGEKDLVIIASTNTTRQTKASYSISEDSGK